MLIRVKVIGSGTESDPFRAPLPRYNMVTNVDADGTVVVDVPDRYAPDDAPAAGHPLRPNLGGRGVLIGLTPKQLADWQNKLEQAFSRNKRNIDVRCVQ